MRLTIAVLVDEVDDRLVHLAAEHHLDHVHGRGVRHPHALDELALPAELLQQVVDLRSAAVHHHRVHADELKQYYVVSEALLQRAVGHGVAAELDDDGLAVETLDIRQRLAEDARLVGGEGVVGGVHGAPDTPEVPLLRYWP